MKKNQRKRILAPLLALLLAFGLLAGCAKADPKASPAPLPEIVEEPADEPEAAGAEIELVSFMSREFKLKNALRGIQHEFDFIFADCPPSLGLLTLNALAASDTLLVPIQCEYYALEGLSQLMNTVRLVKQNLNPELDVEGVVMTMYDARTKLSEQVVREVKKFFRNKVYDTIIPRSVRLGEAPSFGLPITLYDSKCNAAKAYRNLAGEVIEDYDGE